MPKKRRARDEWHGKEMEREEKGEKKKRRWERLLNKLKSFGQEKVFFFYSVKRTGEEG